MSAVDEIQIWPFGKYRGKAVDLVLSDHSYVEWLLHQPWFAEDYAAIYKLITGAASEAQDTPEHNEFQIRFLEEESRLAVARVLDFQEQRRGELVEALIAYEGAPASPYHSYHTDRIRSMLKLTEEDAG